MCVKQGTNLKWQIDDVVDSQGVHKNWRRTSDEGRKAIDLFIIARYDMDVL